MSLAASVAGRRVVEDHFTIMDYRFTVIDNPELNWGFESERPYIHLHDGDSYGTRLYVDPMPGHGHQASLVNQELDRVTTRVPLYSNLAVFLAAYEEPSRTNAHTSLWRHDYSDGKCVHAEPYIFMAGKRIPPHPAMTRHLVAHEYGHAVELWFDAKAGKRMGAYTFRAEYEQMRFGTQGRPQMAYGPSTWVDNLGEIMANDFRLWLGIEEEYWPHTCPRPSSEIFDWWKLMIDWLHEDAAAAGGGAAG